MERSETRRVLGWLLRGAGALAGGNLIGYGCTDLHYCSMTADKRGMDPSAIEFVILPTAIGTALLIFYLLSFAGRRPTWDGETRCRKCGHILRGISNPICPECGEHI